MTVLTKPIKHTPADPVAWKKKWLDNRKPQALANGAQGAAETNLIVTHDVKENDLEKFKKHVAQMGKDSEREEMGAQNMPF